MSWRQGCFPKGELVLKFLMSDRFIFRYMFRTLFIGKYWLIFDKDWCFIAYDKGDVGLYKCMSGLSELFCSQLVITMLDLVGDGILVKVDRAILGAIDVQFRSVTSHSWVAFLILSFFRSFCTYMPVCACFCWQCTLLDLVRQFLCINSLANLSKSVNNQQH